MQVYLKPNLFYAFYIATIDDNAILSELSSLPDFSETSIDDHSTDTINTRSDSEKSSLKRWITETDLNAYFETYPPPKRPASQESVNIK